MFVHYERLAGQLPMPAEWYDDPADRMLVFMGNDPRPGAKYTIRKND